MNAFLGEVGGFANELYDIELATKTFLPRGEASPEPVGIYKITVNVTSGGSAVAGCGISINGLGVIPRTNLQGQAVISVDAGTYQLRVLPPTGFVGVADISVTVIDEDVTIPISLTYLPMIANAPPGTCRLFTYAVDAKGEVLENVLLRATIQGHNVTTESVVIPAVTIQALSDENGYVGIDLIRRDAIVVGQGRYLIELYDIHNKLIHSLVAEMPNQESVHLKDLVPIAQE